MCNFFCILTQLKIWKFLFLDINLDLITALFKINSIIIARQETINEHNKN